MLEDAEMGSPSENEARLLRVLAESDATIAAEQESPEDPVAVRAASVALVTKAETLAELKRFATALGVLDELLSRSDVRGRLRFLVLYRKVWDLTQLSLDAAIPGVVDAMTQVFDDGFSQRPRDAKLLAQAMKHKADTLRKLGHERRATEAESELLDRFDLVPEALPVIAAVLARQASALLDDPERIAEAIQISEQLRIRFIDAPDAQLTSVAETLSWHVARLQTIARPNLKGTAAFVGSALINTTAEGWRFGQRTLDRRAPAIASRLPGPDAFAHATAGIYSIQQIRLRLEQAVKTSDTLVARIGDSDDPRLRRISATAKIYRASALVCLGRIREGLRAFNVLDTGEDPGAASAYGHLLQNVRGQNWLWEGARVASLLNRRATVLGGRDPAIARLAFDDAVNALPAETRNARFTRLAIRLLRPSARHSVVIPDHPPED